MKSFLRKLWNTFWRPATKISLGVISIVGFIAGIMFWINFNTLLEVTNTEKFCISCHSMRDTVYPELQQTVHWSNHSGVRATCPDCHVPHNWTDKIARKVQASKEVYAHFRNELGTSEKFQNERLRLAQNEWERFTANSSKECKNCHNYESMNLDNLKPAGRVQMMQAAARNQSCIDCHKGIAHKLPEEMDSSGGMVSKLTSLAIGTNFKQGDSIYSINFIELFTDSALSADAGVLEPATKVKILEESKSSIKVSLEGWRKTKGFGRVIYEDFALNIPSAALTKAIAQSKTEIQTFETMEDPLTGLTWQRIRIDLWTHKKNYLNDVAPMWDAAKQAYDTNCSLCHTQPAEAHFDANTWPGMFDGMMGFVNFDATTQTLVLKYLQKHSSNFAEH